MKSVKRFLVLHRPDGVIELRRRRLRDSVAVKDAAVLVGLCVGCIAFIALLAAILVETPVLLVATGALVLPMVPALLLARDAELAPAPARHPASRPPDSAA
jgi:hypothetical protein